MRIFRPLVLAATVVVVSAPSPAPTPAETMGFFITYLKVQPFIATLAGMWVARGLCFWISDNAIPIHNRVYDVLAQTKILIPVLAAPVTKEGPFVSILVVVEFAILAIARRKPSSTSSAFASLL
mgnify:CR=1 FL=1